MQLARTLDSCEKLIHEGNGNELRGALQKGKGLNIISENNLWIQTGSKSFEKYVENHLGFGKSTAYGYMAIYRYCHDVLMNDPLLASTSPTRILKLLPYINENNKLDLLHMAAATPDARSFDNNLRNIRGQKGTDECDHSEWEPIPYERCKCCGQKRRMLEAV